jgi:DNA-binding transcriptional ArsR family regulator
MSQLAPFRLPEAPARQDLVAKYFRALGDPTRLRILALLDAEGELSAGELTRRLGLAQPKVSNHLACLRWCGFVDTRREHPTVHYRVADQRVTQLLALGRALLADNAEHVAACRRVDGPGC